jgi:hypothetical protein
MEVINVTAQILSWNNLFRKDCASSEIFNAPHMDAHDEVVAKLRG